MPASSAPAAASRATLSSAATTARRAAGRACASARRPARSSGGGELIAAACAGGRGGVDRLFISDDCTRNLAPGTATRAKDVPGLVRRRRPQLKLLGDADGPLDELGVVAGHLVAAVADVVLQPDADVEPHREAHGGQRKLRAADADHAAVDPGRQPVDHVAEVLPRAARAALPRSIEDKTDVEGRLKHAAVDQPLDLLEHRRVVDLE